MLSRSSFSRGYKDYKVISKIKEGGFGEINLVRNTKDGTKYAFVLNLLLCMTSGTE